MLIMNIGYIVSLYFCSNQAAISKPSSRSCKGQRRWHSGNHLAGGPLSGQWGGPSQSIAMVRVWVCSGVVEIACDLWACIWTLPEQVPLSLSFSADKIKELLVT